jgi:hypothetical protein
MVKINYLQTNNSKKITTVKESKTDAPKNYIWFKSFKLLLLFPGLKFLKFHDFKILIEPGMNGK